MKPTIRELSHATGYSSATISNALSGKRTVNPETHDYILETARKLGYFKTENSKRIRFIIFRSVGLLTDDMATISQYLDGAQKECQRCGYEMTVHYLDRQDEDFEHQIRILFEGKSDLMIVIGSELGDEDETLFRNAADRMILLHYWSGAVRCSGLLVNNQEGMEEAIAYLAEQGHRKIGYLKSVTRFMEYQERETGYLTGMRKKELPVSDTFVVPLRASMDGAFEDMKQYLDKKPELPTAFLAESDEMALGAMKALQEAGYQVPGDISMIGFGNTPYAQVTTPQLSSISYPKQLIGELAVRRILQMQEEEHPPRLKILVCPELTKRESVKSIP